MKRRATGNSGAGGGGRPAKRDKKEKKLSPEEQAVRDEFCSISKEVFAFGKSRGKAGLRKSIYSVMPNINVDKDKGKKRPVLPYKMYQRSIQKRKLLQEKREARAPPPMDNPFVALKKKEKKKKSGRTMAEFLHQKAGNRSGMSGIGDGSRGLNPTRVGHFKDGILHISRKEIEARTGNRGGPRRLGSLTKGRSTAPIGNRSGGGGSSGGWKRKGKAKKH